MSPTLTPSNTSATLSTHVLAFLFKRNLSVLEYIIEPGEVFDNRFYSSTLHCTTTVGCIIPHHSHFMHCTYQLLWEAALTFKIFDFLAKAEVPIVK
mmetsp:Transcript_56514/g.169048  ORF Transcript_56514/g.169048 Transcript_56514/m.169048 type:complete len:96 (+) Transcript_56514:74-361(+)